MSQLPNTLTPAEVDLTPKTASLITDPENIWGRLFPTLECLSAYDLKSSTFKLGKSEDCDCILTQETFIRNKLDNISREHFVIVKEENKPAYIKDLSKNGTFLNGEKIGKRRTHILQNDDEISIGFQGLKVFKYKHFESCMDGFLPPVLKKKYHVVKTLGKGACGEVRLVLDRVTRQEYAMKKIIKANSSKINDMRHKNAIKKEVNILRNVGEHPFIVCIYHVEETPDAFFLVMEHMAGGQLTDLIDSKRLNEQQIKYLFYQIVLAVEYLHTQGIIHRDLKSDNILLKEKDTVNTIIKVSDFGLSKVLEEESLASTRCGTPYYVAPEIVDPTKARYDRKVDIWSLGVLLYYMLTQQLPFKSPDTKILHKQIISGKYPKCESVSDEANDLIERMLTVSSDVRINLEDIPEHPWLKNDPYILERVNDIVYGMGETCDLDETIIAPEAKRFKLN